MGTIASAEFTSIIIAKDWPLIEIPSVTSAAFSTRSGRVTMGSTRAPATQETPTNISGKRIMVCAVGNDTNAKQLQQHYAIRD